MRRRSCSLRWSQPRQDSPVRPNSDNAILAGRNVDATTRDKLDSLDQERKRIEPWDTRPNDPDMPNLCGCEFTAHRQVRGEHGEVSWE